MGEKDFGWEWSVLLHVPTISERKRGWVNFTHTYIHTYIRIMCLFPTVGTGIQFPVGVYLNQKLEKKKMSSLIFFNEQSILF